MSQIKLGTENQNRRVPIAENFSSEELPFIPETPPAKPSKLLFLAAFSALLGAVCFGSTVSYTSPAMPNMEQNGSIPQVVNEEEKSWIGSYTTLGGLVGGLLGGPCASIFGRKVSLIAYGIPFTGGWLLIGFANKIWMIYVGRFITGLCCGLVSGTAPMYVNEISTMSTRGLLGSSFQLSITIGVLITTVIGNYLTWETLAKVSAIPCVMMTILMIFMPESPSYLIVKKGREEALVALKRLRDTYSCVQEELNDIEDEVLGDDNNNNGGLSSMFTKLKQPDVFKPLTYGLALMFFQQMTGINAILFYQKDIFKSASDTLDLNIATIAVATAQTVATLIESLIVDRFGRRMLLLVSGSGVTVSLLFLGVSYYIKSTNPELAVTLGWLPLVCLVGYIVSFNFGFGPIPWMMIPEMTPSHAKGLISSTATGFSWLCAFLVTKYFGTVCEVIEKYGCWWLFCAMSVASILFVLFFLPETSGKSFEAVVSKYSLGLKNSIFIAVEPRKLSATFRKDSLKITPNGLMIRPSLVKYHNKQSI